MTKIGEILELFVERAEPDDDHDLFIKHRSILEPILKNFRKSQAGKHNWVHRSNIEFGIRKWHHSPEGRQFHRQLGRFNSLRPDRQRPKGVFY